MSLCVLKGNLDVGVENSWSVQAALIRADTVSGAVLNSRTIKQSNHSDTSLNI